MIVEGCNIKKLYKNNKGIKDTSFQIKKGRIVALAGGNGAGKSTLIRMLTKQEIPQSGNFVWHEDKIIRFMPDDVNFPPTLTAEEILELLATLKKVNKQEQEDVLNLVGLYDVRKQKVSSFSKGMRQRLNLAQSILGGDGLLILDEPTNGLDPYWISQLKKIMKKEKERGTSVLFSTHMLGFAQELADDVIVLHEGQVLLHGDLNGLLVQNNYSQLEDLWLSKIGL